MATPHELARGPDGGLAPGTLLGKYQVLKHIATGGMAEIFLARTLGASGFERYVVVKCIKPAFATDDQFVEMFLDEARISAQLHHQHIAQVFDMGVESGVLYFAMEHVHGQNVQAVMQAAQLLRQNIPYEHAVAIAIGAATGLDYAHDRVGPDGAPLDLVHRDVTPTNIIVSYDGAVKVVDFGIVKATSRATQTRSGVLKGKLAYMSPEQCRCAPLDRRSDVFALGILLYELTTLRPLYGGNSDYETMDRIVRADVMPPSARRADYPAELEDIVLRCLAKDPDARYQTAAALVEDLLSFAQRSMIAPTAVGLARFMRELFGKPGEPWIGIVLPPTPPPRDAAVTSVPPIVSNAPALGDVLPASGITIVPAPAAPSVIEPAPRRRRYVTLLAALGVLAIAAGAMIAIGRDDSGLTVAAPAVLPVATTPPAVSSPVAEGSPAPQASPLPAVSTVPPPETEPRRKPQRTTKPRATKPPPVVEPTAPVPAPPPPKLRDGTTLRPPD